MTDRSSAANSTFAIGGVSRSASTFVLKSPPIANLPNVSSNLKTPMRIIIILTLTLLIIACGKTPKNEDWLDITKIESVVISQHYPNDSFPPAPRKLTEQNVKMFVDNWNQSRSTGPCKYFPNYFITVYYKDKTERNFRSNGGSIKYITDECFSIDGKDYFDRLWLHNKPICPKGHTNFIIPISYGLPTRKAIEKMRSNELMLGDCMTDSTSPYWYCQIHRLSFGQMPF